MLKAKYYLNGDLLIAKLGQRSSHLMHSLCWGRVVVHNVCGWIVGDGCTIKAYNDVRLACMSSLKVISLCLFHDTSILELMTLSGG